jgi:Uncharacterized conserved protein
MDENAKVVLKDFVKHGDVNEETIKKYEGLVEEGVIEFWREYGYGSFYGGFLQSINPDDYIEVMKESITEHNHNSIPLFITGMSDLIVWEEGYLIGCFYRYAVINTLSKTTKTFFALLRSEIAPKEELFIETYSEAKEKYGELEYGYGFGYVPLLPLGGKMSVDNLDRVRVKEHIMVNAALIGQIDY